MIPPEFIKKINDETNIVNLAEDYLSIQRHGSIYRAECIHKGGDKTPSLTFFPDTNTFHCFSCGAGSKGVTEGPEPISFVMWMENCSFPEAIQKLADKLCIEVPRSAMSPQQKKKNDALSKVLETNRTYFSTLKHDPGMIQYLSDRGITQEEITKFRLGKVPTSDVTRIAGRLAFAIMDESGQTTGFAYRNMEQYFPSESYPDQGPKYVNSPTSDFFNKGSILYGLNFAKKMIREKDYVLIVEGYADAILCQRFGCPTVSLMGTSLTEEQVKILRRYSQNIYVWLDGDQAGINAAIRHLTVLREEGFLIKVLLTPGKDPDEVALELEDGLEAFVLEESILAGQFEINHTMNKFDSATTELKIKTVAEVREILMRLEHSYEREIYVNQIAARLGVSVSYLLSLSG